jgi:RimJ/RimL family protein N-acetyltransferase
MPRLFVDDVSGRIVGAGGFKSTPKDGKVEIGYGIAPACRGHGYATRGVTLLCAEAFASGRVKEILAETSVTNAASERVLEKAGFICYGSGSDDEGPVKLWSKKPDSNQPR